MKNLTIYYFMIAVFMMSCSDDFIDLAPISEANVNNFYKTENDFNAAVIAAYSNLQQPGLYGSTNIENGSGFYALTDVRSDDAMDGDAGAGTGVHIFNLDRFIDDTQSPIIENAWVALYNMIFQSNIILSRIEGADINADATTQFQAEAHFLRGMAYFNLVRLWGDVPIILNELAEPNEVKSFGRMPVSEVYIQVVSDLQFAANNLPGSYGGNELGRATSWSAKALLGKVYLTQESWTESAMMLSDVISNSPHALLGNISDVFDLSNSMNSEIIFAVRFQTGGIVGESSHAGFGTPDPTNLVAAYNVSDERLGLLDIVTGGSASYISKHYDPASNQGRDFILLRHADVLLMYAEALNETGFIPDGEAFNMLNSVRSRAGLGSLNSTDLTSQAELRDAIHHERRLELAMEGSRWFDLLRTGEAISTISSAGGNIAPHQLLYPVPQREVDAYNNASLFPQNTGY